MAILQSHQYPPRGDVGGIAVGWFEAELADTARSSTPVTTGIDPLSW